MELLIAIGKATKTRVWKGEHQLEFNLVVTQVAATTAHAFPTPRLWILMLVFSQKRSTARYPPLQHCRPMNGAATAEEHLLGESSVARNTPLVQT
jgi:hypothetical protein